jgi:hypothetical protein
MPNGSERSLLADSLLGYHECVRQLTFCLAEDRPPHEAALRIAVASVLRHCPAAEVVVYRPVATADFRTWAKSLSPDILVIDEFPEGAQSWDCKPYALLPLLRAQRPEVIWLDSDIIVTRDCARLFAGLDADSIGVSEEQVSSKNQGTEQRTLGWDFQVGRNFARTINTCVLRVTPNHIPLLERWRDLLTDPRYLRYQTLPFHERPLHFLGGQDALNALLGSREFASIPVHWMRTGREVIHSGGALAYSLSERLGGLFRRIPPFVHGQGTKLWWAFDEGSLKENRNSWWFFRRLLLETSPYFAEAKKYRNRIGMLSPWMEYRTWLGRLNRYLGLGHFALRGLPLTLAATIIDRLSGWRPGTRVLRRDVAAEQAVNTRQE